MQKKIIALAIAASISAPAFADNANMSVYGVLDMAVGSVQHSLPVSSTFPGSVNPVSAVKKSTNLGPVTGMFNGGISDSRLGFKGTEDLGNGLSAFFVIEAGFNLPTGQANNAAAALANGANEASANSSLSGQFFNRQANAGIADESWGSVAFGMNYNPIYDVFVEYDPVKFAGLFSPLGFSGTLGGGGDISEDTRVANSIKYKNKFGPINVSALYKVSGSASNGNGGAAAIDVGYEAGDFGIQAVYEQFVDAVKTAAGATNTTLGLAATGTLKATNYNSSAYLLAAKYKLGDATLKAGYEHLVLSAASDNITSPTTMMFGYVAAVTNATGVDLPTDVTYVGGDYNLTATTNVSLGYYNVHNSAAAATTTSVASTTTVAGTTANSQLASDSNYVSLLVDYNFSKRTDGYVGAMFSTFTGDAYAGTNAAYDNSIVAVGMRHKF